MVTLLGMQNLFLEFWDQVYAVAYRCRDDLLCQLHVALDVNISNSHVGTLEYIITCFSLEHYSKALPRSIQFLCLCVSKKFYLDSRKNQQILNILFPCKIFKNLLITKFLTWILMQLCPSQNIHFFLFVDF